MRLIFVRHPRTEANEKNIVYGRTDALYSQAGEASIPGIVEELRDVNIDYLYASPLTRTKILANAIAEDHGIHCDSIHMDDRVLEMNFGLFENHTIDQLKEKFPEEYQEFLDNYNSFVAPEGESFELLHQRVGEFLEEIYHCHEDARMNAEEHRDWLKLRGEWEAKAIVGGGAPGTSSGSGGANPRLSAWEEWSGKFECQSPAERRPEQSLAEQSPAEQRPEQTVVVVAHSMVIHAALAHLLKIDLNEVWHIKIEPGSIVDLDYRCNFAMLQRLAGPFNVRAANNAK